MEENLAIRLALAMKRLRSRYRDESDIATSGISLSQLSILQRLYQQGGMTAAQLSEAEHVSQQAIAQTTAVLKNMSLVETASDPNDARKALLSLTQKGRELRESITASRNAWLLHAIDSTVTQEEIPKLEAAIDLLERLAASPQKK